jgi:hypothetical protein
MLHSFPNIRIGLMVGIGGGAPSQKHDIRLGDVVVSASRDETGGVFQYDFNKTVQGLSFCSMRFLNQPPTILQTAVNGLKALYERKGHQLGGSIDNILRIIKKCDRNTGDRTRIRIGYIKAMFFIRYATKQVVPEAAAVTHRN